MERITWHLNYHDGESVSLNHLAEATDLSWATVQKYTQALETISRITPKISVTDDGINVEEKAQNMEQLSLEEDLTTIVYILIHAEINGGPTEALEKESHQDFLQKYSKVLDELESVGWIERTSDTIKLTPKGVSIAARNRSEVRNLDKPPKLGEVKEYSVNDQTIGVIEKKDTSQEDLKEEIATQRINAHAKLRSSGSSRDVEAIVSQISQAEVEKASRQKKSDSSEYSEETRGTKDDFKRGSGFKPSSQTVVAD